MAKQIILGSNKRYGEELSASQHDPIADRILGHVGDLARQHPDREVCITDIGGAYGDMAYKMCRLAPNVAVEIIDPLDCAAPEITFFNRLLKRQAIFYRVANAVELPQDHFPQAADVVICCQMLHFNPPPDAGAVMQKAWNTLLPGGRLFTSFTSVNESRAPDYFRKPVSQRMICDPDDPIVNVPRMVYSHAEARTMVETLGGTIHFFENGTTLANRNTVMIEVEKPRGGIGPVPVPYHGFAR